MQAVFSLLGARLPSRVALASPAPKLDAKGAPVEKSLPTLECAKALSQSKSLTKALDFLEAKGQLYHDASGQALKPKEVLEQLGKAPVYLPFEGTDFRDGTGPVPLNTPRDLLAAAYLGGMQAESLGFEPSPTESRLRQLDQSQFSFLAHEEYLYDTPLTPVQAWHFLRDEGQLRPLWVGIGEAPLEKVGRDLLSYQPSPKLLQTQKAVQQHPVFADYEQKQPGAVAASLYSGEAFGVNNQQFQQMSVEKRGELLAKPASRAPGQTDLELHPSLFD